MERLFLIAGALSAAMGVAMGAFGAHGLKDRVSEDMLRVWEVGAHYQMVHALGLLAIAWAASRWPGPAMSWAGGLLIVGTVLFSGSLYALALTGARKLGMITPLGGIAFIAGWICLAWAVWRARG